MVQLSNTYNRVQVLARTPLQPHTRSPLPPHRYPRDPLTPTIRQEALDKAKEAVDKAIGDAKATAQEQYAKAEAEFKDAVSKSKAAAQELFDKAKEHAEKAQDILAEGVQKMVDEAKVLSFAFIGGKQERVREFST